MYSAAPLPTPSSDVGVVCAHISQPPKPWAKYTSALQNYPLLVFYNSNGMSTTLKHCCAVYSEQSIHLQTLGLPVLGLNVSFSNKRLSQAWWVKCVIPAFRRQRQENHSKFRATLICIANSRPVTTTDFKSKGEKKQNLRLNWSKHSKL